jgi:hypothetical protein
MEDEEQRDLRSECQRGAGTARYVSARWNSVGSSEVGGSESEPELELLVVVGELERKLRRGVKS